ncbi:MAG: zinc-ribbon domain-containing protein [Lachnospiraceae bacterium]|jgi:hypothetical protein|nr:zinc-ribbon domain-containing protein [Lachnospiraceae bacterium]
MIYCSKCGRKLEETVKYCPGCGNRISTIPDSGNGSSVRQAPFAGDKSQQNNFNYRQAQKADPNSLKYVYVNKKTGKITNNPHVKTGSEGCLQYIVIAFSAVALVILMVVGAVFLTDYFSLNSNQHVVPDEKKSDVTSDNEAETLDNSSDTSSELVSSEIISSQSEVSSEAGIPEEMTAKYMNEKIIGKWRTDVPYKNMNLPGVFEFDGKGKAKCTVKAFLFSKKFEGTYKISDGGKCVLKLDGIEEYFENDTMTGNLKFITDDSMEFTVDNTVWKLNRTE